jgi:hypothetical protein
MHRKGMERSFDLLFKVLRIIIGPASILKASKKYQCMMIVVRLWLHFETPLERLSRMIYARRRNGELVKLCGTVLSLTDIEEKSLT